MSTSRGELTATCEAGMRSKWQRGFLIALILGYACASTPRQAQQPEEGDGAMKLISEAFGPGAAIPRRHTCDGEDVSPALRWSGVPQGTRSLALIMDDPDAPPGTWVHWVLYGLSADREALPENLPKDERLDEGLLQGACWGVDRFSRVGYHGPCPPPGGPHRYFFRLYALDSELELGPRASKAEVLSRAKGHVLAEAELMGTYRR